jgi:hypothetical protein
MHIGHTYMYVYMYTCIHQKKITYEYAYHIHTYMHTLITKCIMYIFSIMHVFLQLHFYDACMYHVYDMCAKSS